MKAPVGYLISGGTAFAVEYGSFLLLLAVSVHTAAASVLSFMAGLLTSFTLNRTWSFAGGVYERSGRQQLLIYCLVAACNVSISTGLVVLGERLGVPPSVGKVIAIGLIAVWNFFIFKHLIFRRSAR